MDGAAENVANEVLKHKHKNTIGIFNWLVKKIGFEKD